MVKISVVIPTRNRCNQLRDAIVSTRNQTFSPDSYEIIVVDNASTDDTRELVERLNQDGGKPIRYMYEPRPGLHWARHAGARAAQGEILAYTDDDGAPTPGWVAALAQAFAETDCAAVGGPVHVCWLSEPPWWATKLYGFAHLDYGSERLELKWPHTIYGPSFAVRKSFLFEVGGFNPDTSVLDRLVGDGEVGLCRKIYAAGGKIVYEPGALVYHQQDGMRLTLANMRHRLAQQARFCAYADYKAHHQSTVRLLRRTGRMLLWAADRKLQALKHWPAKELAYYQHEVNAAAALASAEYYLRLAFSERFRQIVLREDWINDV